MLKEYDVKGKHEHDLMHEHGMEWLCSKNWMDLWVIDDVSWEMIS